MIKLWKVVFSIIVFASVAFSHGHTSAEDLTAPPLAISYEDRSVIHDPARFVNQVQDESVRDAGQAINEGAERAGARAKDAATASHNNVKSNQERAEKADRNIRKGNVHELESGMKPTGFSYDKPNLTVYDSETRVPTVHVQMKTRSIKYKYPGSCVFGRTKVWKVKREGWKVKGWWAMTEVKRPCMKDGEMKLDTPEFLRGETTIRVPQVRVDWVRDEVKFHAPQIRDRDWEEEFVEADDAIEREETNLEATLTKIGSEETVRTTAEVRKVIQGRFAEARKQLDDAEKHALVPFESLQRDLDTKRAEAERTIRAAGGDPAETLNALALEKQALETGKAALQKRFREMRIALLLKKLEVVTRFVGSTGSVVGSHDDQKASESRVKEGS